MKRLATLFAAAALSYAGAAAAACPDYLNTSMRKLHSKESVNFCEAYGGKPMLIVNTASHVIHKSEHILGASLHPDTRRT